MGEWKVTREGPVAVVSLDDGKANAVLFPEFDGLVRALEQVERSDAGAVVLAGRPGYFNAGLNLKILPGLEVSEVQKVIRRFGEAAIALFSFPRPIVAAVGGHALGAGAIFALCCDVRLFADGPFKFGMNEVPGGLFVPTFGIVAATVALPSDKLTPLVLHGRVMSPAEALQLQIAESLHPPEQLAAAALQRATQLADLSGDAYSATKRALRGAMADRARAALVDEVAGLTGKLGAKMP